MTVLDLMTVGVGQCVMSHGLRELGSIQRFDMSDSRVVTRMLILRKPSPGSNSKNTYREVMGISPSFVKADGAGAMRTKRGRDTAKSISGLGDVYLE